MPKAKKQYKVIIEKKVLTPEEILLNALKIAEANGFPNIWRLRMLDVKLQSTPDMFQEYLIQLSRTIIFDPVFAQKLFGDSYKLNLRDCVMEPDPIAYLRGYFALDKTQ